MKTNNHNNLLRAAGATLILSCTVAGIGILKPVFAEDQKLPAPPAMSDGPRDRGPEDRGPRDFRGEGPDRDGGPRGGGPGRDGGPRGEGPDDQDGPRGPRDQGPRGERPGGDGPRGERRGGPRPEGPGGPRGENRRGPREDGPEDRDGGPRGGGPRSFRDGGPDDRPEGGPRREGPDGPRGPRGRDEGGPQGEGPRGERGPGRDGGPEGRGPRGEREDELEHATRDQADLKLFGNLTGDAYNLSGQSRDYFTRATTAKKAGNQQQADQYSRISGQLARAAVSLAEISTGKKLPELKGDGPQDRFQPKDGPSKAEVEKDRATHELNRAYRDLSEAKDGQWNETATRLYKQASADFKANNFEAANHRARVAADLVRAGADS